VNDRGIIWCLDAKTRQEVYGSQRIRAGTYSASPVLAENDLAGYTLSSPAISDGHIFLRAAEFLYSIVRAPDIVAVEVVLLSQQELAARCSCGWQGDSACSPES